MLKNNQRKKRRVRLDAFSYVFALFLMTASLANANEHSLRVLSSAANKIDINISVEHNFLSKGCPNNAGSCYQGTLDIRLADEMPANWRIQFSHLSPIIGSKSEAFSLEHVNGDLHEIRPKLNEYAADKYYQITFFGHTPLISESVLFPNYLLVDTNGNALVIASTIERLLPGHQVKRPQHVNTFERPEQLMRRAGDNVPIASPEERFARFQKRNGDYTLNASTQTGAHRIIPKIAKVALNGKKLSAAGGISFFTRNDDISKVFSEENIKAISSRFAANGIKFDDSGAVLKLRYSASLPAQGYELNIIKYGIELVYRDSAGAFYGMMSVAQLFDKHDLTLPEGTFKDHPNMTFRGLHIDVARNFRSKAFILKTLDQMAYYKLNKLHLHLADDEAWRLQIESLPELTDVGAKRCFDESEQACLSPQLAGGDGKLKTALVNSGYYSTNDYIEILQYAAARHIELIPSLDMPGHSRAAIVSMNARYKRLIEAGEPAKTVEYLLTELADKSEYRSIQHYSDNTLNPCLDSTYRFVDEVIAQLQTMHRQANVPLKRYHIGADETAGAWTQSPACKSLIASSDSINKPAELGPYFVERVANRVEEIGIIPAAWSDGLLHANPKKLPALVHANAWETLFSGGHNKAHKMINKGWDVVLSTPDVLYFDFPYEADPVEPGYYWASRFTDSYQVFQFMPHNLPAHAELWTDSYGNAYTANPDIDIKHNKQILGIQAQLWSETVRSDAQANYMLYPRLLAVAERAWHQPNWAEPYKIDTAYSPSTGHISQQQKSELSKDWLSFSRTLALRAMPQLIEEGVIPRVPLPGAKIVDGKLTMNSSIAGVLLEYKLENEPWKQYYDAVSVADNEVVLVRSRVEGTSVSSREQELIRFNAL